MVLLPRVNPPKLIESTVEAAISDACSLLVELRDEIQEALDNVAGTNLENTSRNQTLVETVSQLDAADNEPEVPNSVAGEKVKYKQANKKRPSRADRRDEAVEMLSSAIAAMETFMETLPEDHDDYDYIHCCIDEMQQIIDEVDVAEFPGMRG